MLNRLLGWMKRDSIEPLYAAIAQEARRPRYFSAPYSVPDTLDGRFELLVLVTNLVMRRLGNRVDGGNQVLEAQQQAQAASRTQRLFDRLFKDLDVELREAGFGESGVPRQIKSMTTGFFGRGQAYGLALDGDDGTALKEALRANLYGTITVDSTTLTTMSHQTRRIADALDRLSDEQIMAGNLGLPTPQNTASESANV